MSSNTSNVVRLPTACTEPVKQLPRVGRFPKSVGRYRAAWLERYDREYMEQQRKAEIAKWQDARLSAQAYLALCDNRLRELHAAAPRN